MSLYSVTAIIFLNMLIAKPSYPFYSYETNISIIMFALGAVSIITPHKSRTITMFNICLHCNIFSINNKYNPSIS